MIISSKTTVRIQCDFCGHCYVSEDKPIADAEELALNEHGFERVAIITLDDTGGTEAYGPTLLICNKCKASELKKWKLEL